MSALLPPYSRLGLHVARLAETNEVRLLICLISAFELSEWFDVVHREPAPDVLPTFCALPALVSDDCKPDFFPVASPVALCPAYPVRRSITPSLSAPIFRFAGKIAEFQRSAAAREIWLSMKQYPTLRAFELYWGDVIGVISTIHTRWTRVFLGAFANFVHSFTVFSPQAFFGAEPRPLGFRRHHQHQCAASFAFFLYAFCVLFAACGRRRACARAIFPAVSLAERTHMKRRRTQRTMDRWHARIIPLSQRCATPFFGAGTTALAADRLQRHYIGIELNPEYISIGERRITGDAPLFAEVAA